MELFVILYRLTLMEGVIFEQGIKGHEEEKTGMFMERMFQSERTTSVGTGGSKPNISGK